MSTQKSSASSFWGGAGQSSDVTDNLNNSVNAMMQSRIGEITWFPPNTNMSKKADYIIPKGNTISKSAYPALWAAVQAKTLPLIGKADWDAKFAASGACMAFCEVDADTFRIPYIKNNAVLRDGSQIAALPSDANDPYTGYGDAIRNITGYIGNGSTGWMGGTPSGCFIGVHTPSNSQTKPSDVDSGYIYVGARFDASKVVPTASENRMVSVFGTSAMYTGNPLFPSLVPSPEWLHQLTSVVTDINQLNNNAVMVNGTKNITINNPVIGGRVAPSLTLHQAYDNDRDGAQGRIHFTDNDNQNVVIRHNTYDASNPGRRDGKSLTISGYDGATGTEFTAPFGCPSSNASGASDDLHIDLRGHVYPRGNIVFEDPSANAVPDSAKPEIIWNYNTDFAKIGFKDNSDSDTDSYMYFQMGDNSNEHFKFQATSGSTVFDLLTIKQEVLRCGSGQKLFVCPNVAGTDTVGDLSVSLAIGDRDTGFNWDTDGVISFWANGTKRYNMLDVTHAASDERIKTNAERIENALDKVMTFDGITYDRTDLNEEAGDCIHEAGFFAQKLIKVFPEAVEIRKQGEYDDFHAVNYGRVTVLHHNAIQELNEKHDSEVKNLHDEINQLKKQVEALVKLMENK